MIIDRLASRQHYGSLGNRLDRALDYLQKTDFSQLDVGEYPVEGRDIYAIVNDYPLTPAAECQLEAHRKYIDIQYLVRGKESIGYAPLAGQEVAVDYDAGSDLVFYAGSSSLLRIEEGMFAIFYPHDLHMPGVGDPAELVRKVVIKVRV